MYQFVLIYKVVHQQKKTNDIAHSHSPLLDSKINNIEVKNKDEKLVVEDIETSLSTTSTSPTPLTEQPSPITRNENLNITNSLLQINSTRLKSPHNFIDVNIILYVVSIIYKFLVIIRLNRD